MHQTKEQKKKKNEETLIELKEKIDSSMIIVRDFNTPLSIIYRPSWQKINKKMEDLNNSINQLNLKDINRALYPTTAE